MTKHVINNKQKYAFNHDSCKETAGVDLKIDKGVVETDMEGVDEALGDASPIQNATQSKKVKEDDP